MNKTIESTAEIITKLVTLLFLSPQDITSLSWGGGRGWGYMAQYTVPFYTMSCYSDGYRISKREFQSERASSYAFSDHAHFDGHTHFV